MRDCTPLRAAVRMRGPSSRASAPGRTSLYAMRAAGGPCAARPDRACHARAQASGTAKTAKARGSPCAAAARAGAERQSAASAG